MEESMIDKARAAIKASSKESSIYIGGDSIRFKKNGKWYARYATVVIVHIDSKHGGKIFHFADVVPDYGNMKQRLLTEVMNTVNVALELLDDIGDRHLEIHLDLNKSPKHKSYVAVQEALGYVRATIEGVNVKIKPEAFAASHCADFCVRGKL
jgi:predicted RNase H-related nuclease YkuK (DUF458 family)